jgi:hypothetical protein
MSIFTGLCVGHTNKAIVATETRCFDLFRWPVDTSIACDQQVHDRGRSEPPIPLRSPSP